MPIYEYRCAACGHHLEALQKMSESPLRKCPECGKQRLKRLVSASRFRLKGSGWYETDFKNDAEKKRNLVEQAGEPTASAEKSDGGTKDGATESKPAAKEDGAKEQAKPKPVPTAKGAAAVKKKPAGKSKAAGSART